MPSGVESAIGYKMGYWLKDKQGEKNMIEKPFIHLFKTTKGRYCYDVNKDEIIQLPDIVYAYLAGEAEKTDYVKTYMERLVLEYK